MKTKLIYLLAGVLALGLTTLTRAEDKSEGRPEGRRGGNFSPEQREKFAREVGLNPDELKNLSPQERMEKFREAADKKLTELQKKQTAGTLTDEEKQTLQRLENMKKMRENRGEGFRGGSGGGEALLKDLGLKPEDVKDLSPDERRAKIKEAADKKYSELQKKQADGSITDDEKKLLQRMEERRKWMQEHQGEHRPGGNKPADKK